MAERSIKIWRKWNAEWGIELYHEVGFLFMRQAAMQPGDFEFESFELLKRRGHKIEHIDRRRCANVSRHGMRIFIQTDFSIMKPAMLKAVASSAYWLSTRNRLAFNCAKIAGLRNWMTSIRAGRELSSPMEQESRAT